jgi:hypothetical protein
MTENEVAPRRTQDKEHLSLADGPTLLFRQSTEHPCKWTPQGHLQQACGQQKQGNLGACPPRDFHSTEEAPEHEDAPIERLDSAALDGKVDSRNTNCMGVVHDLEWFGFSSGGKSHSPSRLECIQGFLRELSDTRMVASFLPDYLKSQACAFSRFFLSLLKIDV